MISDHDVYLINKFILGRMYPRTLHAEFLSLLCNYLTFGIHNLEPDMRDRFLHECLVLIEHNIKSFTKSRGILQICFANFLIQTLVSTSHEYLGRSQVEDLVRRPLDMLEQDFKADIVHGSSRSALHTLLYYCPRITLDVIKRRQCLNDYLTKLNGSLRKVCITPIDRSLLILGLISLLQNTLGSQDVEEYSSINHQSVFKFIIDFLEYHTYLSRDPSSTREKTYSLTEQTQIGNLEKNLRRYKLVTVSSDEHVMLEDGSGEGEEEQDANPHLSRAYDYYNQTAKTNTYHNEESADGDSDDDEDWDDASSLGADEESFEMNGGCFNENSYKRFSAQWVSPITVIDEFLVFNQFVSLLRRSYDTHFIALTKGLSQQEKKKLRECLYTKKVELKVQVPHSKPVKDMRKIYKVKRVSNMALVDTPTASLRRDAPSHDTHTRAMDTEL